MSIESDEFARLDRQRHKQQATSFWRVSLLLTVGLLIAYPPTVAVGTAAGLMIAGTLAAVTVAYTVRLQRAGGATGERELLIASILATVAVAIDQWLAGGISAPLQIMFTLHVLGGSGVLDPRQRRIYLAVLAVAVAAPLGYDTFDLRSVITAIVFIALLAVEAALLGDFADRLKAQRTELKLAEREASARALVDPLTNLGNRRALSEALVVAESNSRRTNRSTVVVLDLDGFKSYNDRFGHGAGDALLERLARALETRIGTRGRAFRLGGDEFCVLLDGSARVGDPIADGIMAALSEDGPDYRVTPSCGMAVMPDDAAYGDDGLRLADERMYVHKRHASLMAGGDPNLLPAPATRTQPA
jgi:diguanylate cyclase (GGDEF)-like protein